MLTGNIGRPGVGVNPLRGQNNVQGSCDMGSFPHELPGYRHVKNDSVREVFESIWGVKIDNEPGLRIPNMLDAAVEGTFKGLYCQGEDILQSDPDTKHVAAGLAAMECVIVHDLFLNETANYAHVFFPGSTFLEKDGTFTNAERRINRVRKVMAPKQGYADWEVTQLFAQAMGADWHYTHPSQIMDEIAMLTPSFAGVSYEKLETMGSIQWPCNESAPEGTPLMHIDGFVRGKGKFIRTEYVATDEKTGPRFPLLLTTGRILSQYNVGAQTRRTENVVWHEEDLLEIHPHDAELRGVRDGQYVKLASRVGGNLARGQDHRSRVAGRGLHHLPPPDDAGERHHHRLFRLGHQLPGIQGDGGAGQPVQRPDRMAGRLCRPGRTVPPHSGGGMMDTARRLPRLSFGSRSIEQGSRPLPEEVAVALSFNGSTQAVMMATPDDLVDFAYGFALTEGIATPDQIESVEVQPAGQGIDVQVWLVAEAEARLAARRRTMAGPVGCGLCGIDSIEQAMRPVAQIAPSAFRMTPAAGDAGRIALSGPPTAARCHPRRPLRGVLVRRWPCRRARGCGAPQRAGQAGGPPDPRRPRAGRGCADQPCVHRHGAKGLRAGRADPDRRIGPHRPCRRPGGRGGPDPDRPCPA